MKSKLPPILKPAEFLGSSLDDLRQFPESAQDDLGHQIDDVQRGRTPPNWKPMKTVGQGVKELRYEDPQGWFRVVYIATLPKGV